MSSAKFCACFDLRHGSLLFVWLQMFLVAMAISIQSNILRNWQMEADKSTDFDYIFLLFHIAVGFYVIKVLTLLPLTWGILKRKCVLYNPWFLISAIEIFAQILLAASCFVEIFYELTISVKFAMIFCITAMNCYIYNNIYKSFTKKINQGLMSADMIRILTNI